MSNKFVYTITTGRSGTVFLTHLLEKNLAQATVHHERLGFQNFGVHTPDASHFTLFNSVGNNDKVQEFWRGKFRLDAETATPWYVETSHFLSKAGLIENLPLLAPEASEIHIIHLKRDIFKTLWSYVNRFDFFNVGFTWLFTLDNRYPKVILNARQFDEYGMFGHALWYILEMQCRAHYYKLLLADNPNVVFHSLALEDIVKQAGAAEFLSRLTGVDHTNCFMPPKANATSQEYFGKEEYELCRQLVKKFDFDPAQVAKLYFDGGYRL